MGNNRHTLGAVVMGTRKRTSVFLDPELLDGLKAIKARTFAPEAASIRQAVREYLERHGVPQSKEDVAEHDVVVYESLGGIPGFEWMREPDRARRITFRANDAVALTSAACAGLGLAALPCMLADGEAALERVPTLGFSRCEVLLVGHEQMRRVLRVRIVSDFVIEAFRRQSALIRG